MLIEIFSDLVCPWCYIGKRRLDGVLEELGRDAFEVRWRAFQLYPMLPPDGVARADFMRARFGTGADPARIYARILEEAAPLGLELDFAAIERAPNTLRAHRLLAWAGDGPYQHALAETLFRSYFTEGLDLCDPAVLAHAAARAGIDPAAARHAIESGAAAADVERELARAREAEITGVPLYLLAGRFAIPGAQQPDVLRHFIERARTRLEAQPSR